MWRDGEADSLRGQAGAASNGLSAFTGAQYLLYSPSSAAWIATSARPGRDEL